MYEVCDECESRFGLDCRVGGSGVGYVEGKCACEGMAGGYGRLVGGDAIDIDRLDDVYKGGMVLQVVEQ